MYERVQEGEMAGQFCELDNSQKWARIKSYNFFGGSGAISEDNEWLARASDGALEGRELCTDLCETYVTDAPWTVCCTQHWKLSACTACGGRLGRLVESIYNN